jgi:cobalamin biosynthesis protein CobW
MTPTAAKIPATIVTGFLGAGKTTLIRNAIAAAAPRRIAVIVNEFGDLGFDGDLIAACDAPGCAPVKVVELTNGCICCTVADDFQPALEAILALEPKPEHILIETSGLALPKPLIKAFDWPGVRSRVTVDGVIAVVDGPAAAAGQFAEAAPGDPAAGHDFPLAEVFEDQIAVADLVLVNKRDAMDDAAVEAVRALIAREAPRNPPVILAEQARAPVAALLGLGAAAEDDLAARPTHHDAGEDHDHDDFESLIAAAPEFPDVETARLRVAALAGRCGALRVKGHVRIAGKPMRLAVQGVGARVAAHFDGPWREGQEARLVVIGLKGLDRAGVDAALAV